MSSTARQGVGVIAGVIHSFIKTGGHLKLLERKKELADNPGAFDSILPGAVVVAAAAAWFFLSAIGGLGILKRFKK